MQIGRKMTDLGAFEVLSVILEHPGFFIFILSTKGNTEDLMLLQ